MGKEGINQKDFDRVCILLQVCVLLIFMSVINMTLNTNERLHSFFFVTIIISSILPFIHKLISNYLISTNLLILTFIVHISYLITHTNGIFSPFLFWFLVPIVVSSIFFRTRTIIFWATIISGIFVYLLYQDIFGKNILEITDDKVLVTLYKQSFINLFIFITFCLSFHSMKIKNRLQFLYDGNEKVGSLIQILSHDIINPLNLILGFTEVLKDEIEDDELPEGILRASRQIQQIINHVKEMQALESGKRNLELEPIDLEKCLENVTFVFQEKAKRKRISLIIKNEVDFETKILAEPVSFSHQVLNNLVSNAIKFTPEHGEIVIHSYKKGQKVHVNIQDTGIGIPQKLIPNLFRFDVATSRAGTEGESGTGFGLPLVKKYIELYNGEIFVESVEASSDIDGDIHGTNFHIILNCT